ncbi:uncharacterized protein [Triticum aestivum]|uniref:uncharacterized protein n=1 Tax=Triticum aestivum TaxID=4565 RepID=UPI001D0223C6|nr:uncharacterized protein LOC123038839 [Triticum aestivum]
MSQAIVQRACAKLSSALVDETVARLNFTADLRDTLEAFDAIQPMLDKAEMQPFMDSKVSFWLQRACNAAYKTIDTVDELQDARPQPTATVLHSDDGRGDGSETDAARRYSSLGYRVLGRRVPAQERVIGRGSRSEVETGDDEEEPASSVTAAGEATGEAADEAAGETAAGEAAAGEAAGMVEAGDARGVAGAEGGAAPRAANRGETRPVARGVPSKPGGGPREAREGAEKKLIGDLLAKVTELVNKLLEAHAIIVSGRVELLAPKKLTVQENLTLERVVGEEAVELSPNGVSIFVGGDHRVEEVLRDDGVEPTDKSGVDGRPLLIVLHEAGVHGTIDVISEIVLTEHEGEVRLPGIVSGGEVIEDDGNPSEDVEITDDDGIGAFERVGAAAAGGTGGGHGREGVRRRVMTRMLPRLAIMKNAMAIQVQETKKLVMWVQEYSRELSGYIADKTIIFQKVIEERKTGPVFEEAMVLKRGSDKQRIIAALLSTEPNITQEHITILPIFGFPGSGKTTLAQMVFNDTHSLLGYDFRAWVHVSPHFNFHTIGKFIICQVSGRGQEEISHSSSDVEGMESIMKRLHKLLDGKKVLLVLDELWEEDPIQLQLLKSMLTFLGDKMDVIVTTCNQAVARKTCTVEPYRLKLLSDETCWEIIKKSIRFEAGEEELEKIGRKITSKCWGVPSIARQYAGMLDSSRDANKWKRTMQMNIWSWGVPSALSSLELCYMSMPPDLRLCFDNYCAVFPTGHNIVKDDLVQQWIALHLVEQSDILSAAQIAEKHITRLQDMAFLQTAELDHVSNCLRLYTFVKCLLNFRDTKVEVKFR